MSSYLLVGTMSRYAKVLLSEHKEFEGVINKLSSK